MSKEGTRAKQVRRKQLLIAGSAAGLVLLVAGGAAVFVNNGGQTGPAAPVTKPLETKPITTGGAAYDEQGAWRTQVTAEVQGLRKQLDEYKAKDAEEKAKAAAAAQFKAMTGGGTAAPPNPPPGASEDPNAAGGVFAPPPPPKGGQKTTQTLGGPIPIFQAPNAPTPPPTDGDMTPKPKIGTVLFSEGLDQKVQQAVGGAGGQIGAPVQVGAGPGGQPQTGAPGSETGELGLRDGRQAGPYIPAGTFARMLVLNGLDAPTGGQSQANPAPVLLKIIDSATLPNGYKANLSGCILTANGYGDVSSERAYLRLDRLTCVAETGGTVDIGVKGYVAGEDGKAGMRGRLVTKTGQILANALLAGIGSGIGQAFSASATTTTTNPFGGTTQTTNPGKELQGGLSAGVGKAFDTLAKYYVQLADKTFPIIEVDGGRVADIVFTKGFTLEGR